MDSSWRKMYRVGAAAALLAVVFFRRNLGAELTQFNGFGLFTVPAIPPVSALEWLTLLLNNRFVAMALLGAFDLVNYLLIGLVFLALYGALRREDRSVMLLALILAWAGAAVYFASNQSFAMLDLSRGYSGAANEAQREMALAAGEALLAADNPGHAAMGTGGYLSLLLFTAAGLLIAMVMRQSQHFSRSTAVIGIITTSLQLLYFPVILLAPALNWLPPTLSAPFRIIWYMMIAVQLFKLSNNKSNDGEK